MLYDLYIVAHIQHILAYFSARPPLAVDIPSINPPCQLPLVVTGLVHTTLQCLRHW